MYYPVNNDDDFLHYYAQVRRACMNFVEENHSEINFEFYSFYNASMGTNKRYAVTYKAFNFDTLENIFINLTVIEENRICQIIHSKISSKA